MTDFETVGKRIPCPLFLNSPTALYPPIFEKQINTKPMDAFVF